ncbi:AMP-binding protein [Pseudodesulfovibrio cashew]|uniref:AMP-binding protein n=1 Tax=Pseudodesulfovibrio cashew TaxID=2678688 RepID=A0A6I6JG82_9BACT|nr:AMP-binding protein [Pseudodesulfovibrio cashew]QGY41866.1 AMP-binding protein [Pseudodesulfovibrio cashew]
MNAQPEYNFAAELLLDRGARWADRTALICDGGKVTYAELAAMAKRMAQALRNKGAQPGSRILIAMPDSLSSMVVFLGGLLAGVSAAVVNNRVMQSDYEAYLEDCGAQLVFANPGHPALDAASAVGREAIALDDQALLRFTEGLPDDFAPHPVAGDEEAVIFYTSGTTGRPKGIPHTHSDFRVVAESGTACTELGPDNVILSTAKLFHAYGLMSSLSLPLWVGAATFLYGEKPDPSGILKVIAEHGITVFTSSPTFYTMLLMSVADATPFANLRLCMAAGEGLPEAIQAAWKTQMGIDIWQAYGSSESMTINISTRPPDFTPGTVGRVLPPYEAAVLDEEHRPVPDGTEGELALKGPSLTRGYLNMPEKTEALFTADGWMLSGDLARIVSGVVTVLGRKDDMFKAGGQWVSPVRVENVLLEHPAVAQCAVTGGAVGAFSLVRAHVVPASGFEADRDLMNELRQYAADRLPEFMVPSEISFREDMPMTPLGKIQRFALR